METPHILVVGCGFSGFAIAREARRLGWHVSITSRASEGATAPEGATLIDFARAGDAVGQATHLVATAAPAEGGDPMLTAYGEAIAAAKNLRWLGYLSTTGVYGDRGGGWVDEDTPPAPRLSRAARRVAAEAAWSAFGDRLAVDLFRTAGIYGPGRSAIDDVRAGRARRIVKPGHAFGRIHRDDIAGAVMAAAAQSAMPRRRVLHLADDTPSGPAEVVAEAARLLGMPLPPEIAFADAVSTMSEMGRGFWAENRLVSSAKTQAMLERRWRYPSFREGLAAILAEEELIQRRG